MLLQVNAFWRQNKKMLNYEKNLSMSDNQKGKGKGKGSLKNRQRKFTEITNNYS